MPDPARARSGFWAGGVADQLGALRSTPQGLGSTEAADRLRETGPNLLRVHRQRALIHLFLARFRNPLILLLLGASLISGFTGDLTSCVVITAMIAVSVALDCVQEYRAGRAAERLRESVAVTADVLRDGRLTRLPVADLVPGDVVLLAAGDMIPADGRLLEADDFFVNQAMLTGEPYPVEKRCSDSLGSSVAFSEATNAVFMGTSVVSGSARMLIVCTGAGTIFGEIGRRLDVAPPPTAFETGTRSFGLLILRLAFAMVVFVVLVNTLRHRPGLESFLFAVALAVGLTPELLPMVVSVTLSRGALRMARRKVIVKRLAAIHDLGAMDTLCTDKTGTLTEARIRLEKHLDGLGRESERVLELAYYNSFFESGLRSPLDEAILRHSSIDTADWRKVDEVPFDFERRRVSVLIERSGAEERLLVVKGALEDVLRLSTRYETEAGLASMDEATRGEMIGRFEALGREGYRVLGIAWKREGRELTHAVVGDETELVFAGFAAFEDPPKLSARAALEALGASGVSLKVVTGDNEWVTQHLCQELGLPVQGVLTGAQIQEMGDDALSARVESSNLFCRVTPFQKNRVILALKSRGHVVGYLGDGINDAPSLHTADVGISVEGGVDVAKEAADLILLEPDLGVLQHGVMEGRRTFGNIMKYIMMATSSNFGNMFSMAGASMILPFLPMLPTQVLLNNFLYDLSEIPIPMDSVDEEDLRRPRHWDVGFIRNFMLAVGPVSSIFDFLTFYLMLHVFHAGESLFQTGWFIESLATQVLVIFVIRTRGNPLRSRPSRLLALTSVSVVALAALLPFTPVARDLGMVPPPAAFFVALAGMVVVYLLGVEVVKRWFFRRMAVRAPG